MQTRDRYCIACFNKIKLNSIPTLFLGSLLCDECLSLRKIFVKKEKLGDMDVFYLSYHDGVMSQWLYQYKTVLDYELRKVFLTPYEDILRLISIFCPLVLAPSTKEGIDIRGFNHLEEILKFSNIRYMDILGKKEGPDQKDLTMDERKNVKDRIYIKENKDIKGKHIILFDDVMTTGSTLLACRDKLKDLRPKSVTGLVLMRQRF